MAQNTFSVPLAVGSDDPDEVRAAIAEAEALDEDHPGRDHVIGLLLDRLWEIEEGSGNPEEDDLRSWHRWASL